MCSVFEENTSQNYLRSEISVDNVMDNDVVCHPPDQDELGTTKLFKAGVYLQQSGI